MSEQVHRSTAGQREVDTEAQAQDVAAADAEVQAAQERPPADLNDVDELLDEIDAILEANAEDFVRGYVQKGGE